MKNMVARKAQMQKNYEFFGAPVGPFMVIDRHGDTNDWMHLGMFMQSLALLAVVRKLGTCMQEYWATVRVSLHRHLALPEREMVYCCMALGYPDLNAPVNGLRSDRAPVDEFASLRGF